MIKENQRRFCFFWLSLLIMASMACDKLEEALSPEPEMPNIVFSKYEIYSDDNGDQIPNRGETARIHLYLKNKGSADAGGVEAYLNEDNPYIAIIDNYTYFGTLSTGQETYGDYAFDISTICPYGYNAVFYLSISDDDGNTWTDTLTIIIEQIDAEIRFSKYEIYYDDSGDQIPNRGETIGIRLYLKNEGTSYIPSVSVYLTEDDPYVSITDNTGYFSSLYPGTEKSDSYQFSVSNICPYDHTVTFLINISDSNNNNWADTTLVTIKETNAKMEFSRYEIYNDTNNNGIANPDEDIYLKLWLKNSGTSKAIGVEANLIENDDYVSVVYTRDNYFGTFEPGEEDYSDYYYSYRFYVLDSCPVPYTIPFYLSINDEDGNVWADSFTVPVE